MEKLLVRIADNGVIDRVKRLAEITYVSTLANVISVEAKPGSAEMLRRIPGVLSVEQNRVASLLS